MLVTLCAWARRNYRLQDIQLFAQQAMPAAQTSCDLGYADVSMWSLSTTRSRAKTANSLRRTICNGHDVLVPSRAAEKTTSQCEAPAPVDVVHT
jgi:hypothetical protein